MYRRDGVKSLSYLEKRCDKVAVGWVRFKHFSYLPSNPIPQNVPHSSLILSSTLHHCCPQLPGLVLPPAQKLILDPLATITLKVVPFHVYAPIPVLLLLFKCILEVVLCEGVQHHLQFCLHRLNCVKMPVSSIGGNRKDREPRVGGG
jgi:hypothetical protein